MTSTLDTITVATPPADGDHRAIWLLNSLMIERATAADTGGLYTVFEQWITPEGNPPPHVHEHEDEAFMVLEGEIEVTVAGDTVRLGPGGFAFAPRGVPHAYGVVDGVARLIIVATPGGCEHFFRELGDPAESLTLPVPTAPDVARVVAVAAQHGISILPPPA
jgi:quercetin dioxygenase-like cupin family protein